MLNRRPFWHLGQANQTPRSRPSGPEWPQAIVHWDHQPLQRLTFQGSKELQWRSFSEASTLSRSCGLLVAMTSVFIWQSSRSDRSRRSIETNEECLKPQAHGLVKCCILSILLDSLNTFEYLWRTLFWPFGGNHFHSHVPLTQELPFPFPRAPTSMNWEDGVPGSNSPKGLPRSSRNILRVSVKKKSSSKMQSCWRACVVQHPWLLTRANKVRCVSCVSKPMSPGTHVLQRFVVRAFLIVSLIPVVQLTSHISWGCNMSTESTDGHKDLGQHKIRGPHFLGFSGSRVVV